METSQVSDAVLAQILGQLQALQVSQQALQAKVRPPIAPSLRHHIHAHRAHFSILMIRSTLRAA
jgi:hypothetical protein